MHSSGTAMFLQALHRRRFLSRRFPVCPKGQASLDCAGYDIQLLKYCEDAAIRFAVGCPISESVREAIKSVPKSSWKSLDASREYAEICFVPSSLSKSKRGYEFRYVAIRERLKYSRSGSGTGTSALYQADRRASFI